MDRAIPGLNKQIKRREEERNRTNHLEHLRQMRPITTGLEDSQPMINNRKREQLLENRFTQIERENRILLEKISGIMGNRGRSQRRRGGSGFVTTNETPKSLNVTFRKKQFQEIEIENAKLLRRLQQKKSDYQVDKMNKDWKKKKYVIRNISSYPIAIFQRKKKERSDTGLMNRTYKDRGFSGDRRQRAVNSGSAVQIVRNKNITGHNFVVTIRLDDTKMMITAVQQNDISEAKIIEIPKDQALAFLSEECGDRIQALFDLLYYDGETLFLIGEADLNAQPQAPEDDQTTKKPEIISNKIHQQPKSKEPIKQQKDQQKKLNPLSKSKSKEKSNQKLDKSTLSKKQLVQAQKTDSRDQVKNSNSRQNIAPLASQQYPQEHFGDALEQMKVVNTQEKPKSILTQQKKLILDSELEEPHNDFSQNNPQQDDLEQNEEQKQQTSNDRKSQQVDELNIKQKKHQA